MESTLPPPGTTSFCLSLRLHSITFITRRSKIITHHSSLIACYLLLITCYALLTYNMTYTQAKTHAQGADDP